MNFLLIFISPIRAPADVARGEVFVRGSLLDQNFNLLFVVALVGCKLFVLSDSLLIFGRLVGVVELETSQLILDTLDYDFCDLVKLILADVFLFVLH
jgi:hypothetical protein